MHQASTFALGKSLFRLQVPPGQAFDHPRWRQARAAVLAGLDHPGAVALLGLPGIGKTMLLTEIARTLRDQGRSAHLFERGDAVDLTLTADILLVDEAARADMGALAALCATGKPLVLAALPDFAAQLSNLPRAIVPVTLGPLSLEEVVRYVIARLSATGRPRDMFEPEAVIALAQHSGGALRSVNILAGTAVFLAELEGATHVAKWHVDEAAATRRGTEDEPEAAPAIVPLVPLEPAPPPASEAVVEIPRTPLVTRPVRLPRRAAWPGRAGIAAGAIAAALVVALVGAQAFWKPPAVQPQVAQAGPVASAGPARIDASPEPSPVRPDSPPPAADEVRTDPAPVIRMARRGSTPPEGRNARQATALSETTLFRGPIYNDTIGQGGQVRLVIKRDGGDGAITAQFDASAGLVGSGKLDGHVSTNGRITASGQLMMGTSPFLCDLNGVIVDDTLTGSANFVRTRGGPVNRSRFTLTRS